MKILVTGAKGFVGKNLCAELRNIRDGKARCYGDLPVGEVFEYDLDTAPALLDGWCREADFVFNLAGVNRPKDEREFMAGNFGFASTLLATLRRHGNACPVMLASSIQATLLGRYAASDYGKSKLAGEELFFRYGQETGAKVLVYRFPNLFGKWCRPNYNSAVATFCHHIAHDEPVQVSDPSVELELLYIDDLVQEMIAALRGGEHHCEFEGVTAVARADGRYCHVPVTHRATLGRIVDTLRRFSEMPRTLDVPHLDDAFEKKLYSTYLSYLPAGKFCYPLLTHTDERGSFTEFVRTLRCGQFSVNVSRPGVVKGQHWHHTKNEKFVVVSGHGLIRQRRLGTEEVVEFPVSAAKLEVIEAIPGYTHDLVNLSPTDDMVTLIWCNEPFDPQHPDTYHEEV